MLLLNKSEDWGFKWIEFENTSAEAIDTFVTELIRQIDDKRVFGLPHEIQEIKNTYQSYEHLLK
jgi:hypothetical protein